MWTGSSRLLDALPERAVAPAFRDDDRAVAAGARDPQRPALHLPRRRAARGAADARRRAPARPARDGARARAARPRGDRAGPRGSAARLSRCRGASRSPAGAGGAPPRGGLRGLVPGARRERARPRGCSRRRARSGWPPSSGRVSAPCSPARASSPTCACPPASPPPPRTRRRAIHAVRGHLARLGPCTVAELARADRPRRDGDSRAPGPARGGRLSSCGGASIPRGRPSRSSASAGSSPGSTGTRPTGSGGRSSRSPHRICCASSCAGSTSRRAAAGGAAGPPRRDRAAAGFEIAAGSWEAAVLPARVRGLSARMARRAVPVGPACLGRVSQSAALPPETQVRLPAAGV